MLMNHDMFAGESMEERGGTGNTTPCVFTFPMTGDTVRIVEHEGEPWFVARDVAVALGYENPAEAVRDNCKKVNKITQHNSTVNHPPVSLLIIPETDVYRLIMRSSLPAAEAFQDWVCEEVLPAIRKRGGYMVAHQDDTLETLSLRALNIAQDAIERLQSALAEVKPKAEKYDRFCSTEGTLNLTQAAKQLGMTSQALGKFLRNEGPNRWLFKTDIGLNMPLRHVIEKGYMTLINVRSSRNGYLTTQGRITPRGMDVLYSLLKD